MSFLSCLFAKDMTPRSFIFFSRRWLHVYYAALVAFATTSVRSHELPLGLAARDTPSSLALPKAVSDLTTVLTRDASGNYQVYILGGCDAENGNVFNKGFGVFVCSSVSDSLFRFDVASQTFTTLATMPSPRYRHAAVAMGNSHIWVMGGRDVDDNLIGTVDVYDIESDTWNSYTDLPDSYYSSDLAGFGHNNLAFFVGGYDATYNYLSTVFAIDTEGTLAGTALVIQDKAPLTVPRGDLTATVNDDETYAIVTGGFGATSGFCAPLAEVEEYDFERDVWITAASMNRPRSDMALVELNGNIIALGGERQLVNICEIDNPEAGEATLAVDAVEVLDMEDASTGVSSWSILDDLPRNRFRFSAVAIDEQNAIYTFGGQLGYDSTCECYRTTSEIIVYDAVEDDHSHDSGAIAVTSKGLFGLALMGIALFI